MLRPLKVCGSEPATDTLSPISCEMGLPWPGQVYEAHQLY